MNVSHYPLEIKQELAMARRSRREGNEGRARVCARRAAGFAVQHYLREEGLHPGEDHAYQVLFLYREQPNLSTEVIQALRWLTTRVDHDHQLPEGVDLVREAEVVITSVFEHLDKAEPDD